MGLKLLGKKGTPLTTNPSVTDVRYGVQFQSTAYPNGVAGQNGDNASITSSIITPPSAYALGIEQFLLGDPSTLDLGGKGVSSLSATTLENWLEKAYRLSDGGSYTYPYYLNLYNNGIPRVNLIELLTACAAASPNTYTIDISGGYNDVLDEQGHVSWDFSNVDLSGEVAGWIYIAPMGPYAPYGYCYNLKTTSQNLDPSRPQGGYTTDYEVPLTLGDSPEVIANAFISVAQYHLQPGMDLLDLPSGTAVVTWYPVNTLSIPSGALTDGTVPTDRVEGFNSLDLLSALTAKTITVYHN